MLLAPPNTWTASEAEAVALGGHLATVRSQAENDWIFAQFGQFEGVARGLWIGLYDSALEGTFVWSSGEPVSYLDWAANEPNNQDGLEVFVHLIWHGEPRSSHWNDLADTASFPGIPLNGVVEIQPGDVAIPTTTPPSGYYALGTNVVLGVSTPGAVIRYTTDGSEPTEASPAYATPIPVTSDTVLKARAYRSGWQPSARGGRGALRRGTSGLGGPA